MKVGPISYSRTHFKLILLESATTRASFLIYEDNFLFMDLCKKQTNSLQIMIIFSLQHTQNLKQTTKDTTTESHKTTTWKHLYALEFLKFNLTLGFNI